MPNGLSIFRFAPAIKIIGRTIGKIFNRLYTVLTEGDEHSRRYAWNILESGFNAKLLSLSFKIRLNARPDERRGLELGTKSCESTGVIGSLPAAGFRE